MAPTPSPAPGSNRWYLAYGSNLSSDTFRGRRGIHPLAQVNVIVPSLELTFDLPGIPYWEPCFANVRMREYEDEAPHEKISLGLDSGRRELIGVAYLVTSEDFARIIATEGGGMSYEEVEVECRQIHGTGLYRKTAQESKRIIASTLLAPDSKRRSAPMQPSKRYVDIIRAGAREHALPASYIAYLDSIPYYHTTGLRQKIGATLFLAAWFPVLLVMFLLQMLFADPNTGRLPEWVRILEGLVYSAMWTNYEAIWKKIFGSGEVSGSRETGDEESGQKIHTEESERFLDVSNGRFAVSGNISKTSTAGLL